MCLLGTTSNDDFLVLVGENRCAPRSITMAPFPELQQHEKAARDVSLKQIRRLPVGIPCDEKCLLMLLGRWTVLLGLMEGRNESRTRFSDDDAHSVTHIFHFQPQMPFR